MSQPDTAEFYTFKDRMRATLAERSTGIVAALVLEALLLALLFTLGQSRKVEEPAGVALTTFDAASDDEASEENAPEPQERQNEQRENAEPVPPDAPVPVPVEIPPTALPRPNPAPALIPLPRDVMAQADISNRPRPSSDPSSKVYGPVDTGTPGDSERVGTAPNGAPLYAARWYREPTDQELAGYLSTAQGPGWGLIACKTVADFRVEDCVGLSEYPSGSNINRAVLAAAWQFRVRPPRLGGRSLVGEWVRIRIDYRIRPK